MKILLDSDILNAFTGNSDADLRAMDSKLKTGNHELCVTHIQIDERYAQIQEYNEKISKLADDLTSRGVDVSIIPTNIAVIGSSRVGLAKFGSDLNNQFYTDLKKGVDKCEKGKKAPGNLVKDAMIGTSSLGCELLITGDKCLKRVLDTLIEQYSDQLTIIPEVVRRNPLPQNVLNEIYNHI